MKPIFHRKVQRFIKSLKDDALLRHIQKSVDAIIQNPSNGKLLEQPFRAYRVQVVRFAYKGQRYRIAYTVQDKTDEIVFLLIDQRKDFYEKLRRVV